jgi:hypothetical protein
MEELAQQKASENEMLELDEQIANQNKIKEF